MAGVCVTVWFPEIVGFPSKDLNFGVFGQKTEFGPNFFGPILRLMGKVGRELSAPSQFHDVFVSRAYCQGKNTFHF